ncbi:MAG: PAS domain S-box protein [Deltaproteobacteria bacterium]|nr:PAS domain S-box protein [Deltaproteobacteria bacterium]
MYLIIKQMDNIEPHGQMDPNSIEHIKKRIVELEKTVKELKRVEKELKEIENKYKDIFENATEGIFQTTREGKILNANPSFAKIHGYSSPEEIIREINDIGNELYVNPKDRQNLIERIENEGRVSNFEVQMYRKDGTIHWVSINLRAIKDKEGKTLYYEGTMQDITERKIAEEALKESEERYRVAIEHSNDGVAIIGDLTHLYVNQRFVEIFGYDSPDEIIGKPITYVVHPDDHELVKSISLSRKKGDLVPKRYEFKGVTKTGNVIYLEVSGASITYKGQPAYLVYLRDITKRKESEKLLMEEKERLNTLLENAPIGIALISEKGSFKYVNPKFTEIFGYDRKDVPDGKTFLRYLFPDQKYRRKVISGWIENIKNTQVGQKFPRIFTVRTSDGKEKVVNFIPVRLATGEHIIAFEDITERIQAEEALRRSKDELERLNIIKSKAIDHISHELKTPASVLLGSLKIIKKKLAEMNLIYTFEKMIDAMERNVSRILEISKETDELFRSQVEFERVSLTMEMDDFLKRLERMTEVPPTIRVHWEMIKDWLLKNFLSENEDIEDVELSSFIKDLIESLRKRIEHRQINISFKDGKKIFIRTNPRVLANTINAIVKNAIENTPDGGTVEIELEKLEDRVLTRIRDTGVGITQENLSYIFDGLFHTQATELYRSRNPYDFGAGGKGLELLMIRRYAIKYGFDVKVESKRCVHIPTEKDVCPGNTKLCKYISEPEECATTGGTVFTLSFVLPNP